MADPQSTPYRGVRGSLLIYTLPLDPRMPYWRTLIRGGQQTEGDGALVICNLGVISIESTVAVILDLENPNLSRAVLPSSQRMNIDYSIRRLAYIAETHSSRLIWLLGSLL